MKGWLVAILMWTAILVVYIVAEMTPNSHWIAVDKIFVHDAAPGQSPAINIRIAINTRFVLRWHATIRQARSDDSEDFVGVCSTNNESEVWPERKFPKEIDIDWWMQPTHCSLVVGVYYLESIFSWHTPFGPRKFVVDSNIFHVKSNGN